MIRRPLFFVTFSFAAAIAVSSCFGMKTAAVAAAAVIAAVAVLKNSESEQAGRLCLWRRHICQAF